MASIKEQVWLEEYLISFNATDAARRAGYKHPNVLGPTKKAKFAVEISERLAERAMSADEVLQRLAEQARGDAADFLDIDENVAIIDIGKMAAAGKTHLIKKYRVSKDGISVELYDAQAALVHLGKHHGLFVDRKEITGKDGGPLLVVNWDDPNDTD